MPTPKPMLERIEPSVDKLIEHVVKHSDYQPPTAPAEHSETPTESTHTGGE